MTVRHASPLAALALLATPALAQESAPESTEDAPAQAPSSEVPPSQAASGVAGAPAPEIAAQRAIVASPFSPDQRNGWLAQCRGTFLRAGAALGGLNGLPDACETQLIEFERTYVPAADGRPPTIWVRVPVARAAVAPVPPAAPVESPQE